jgi:hypothetical protein
LPNYPKLICFINIFFMFFHTLNFYSSNSMWCDKLYYGTFVDNKIVQSKCNVIISKFKMLSKIERYVHNHCDFIISFALYSYIIVMLSTLLMIIWKIAVWDSILPPPIMLSQIPMVILALLFIKKKKKLNLK